MPTVTIWHASWCAPCIGTLRDLVPRFREEGIDPVLMDVDDHPCTAEDRRNDPTMAEENAQQVDGSAVGTTTAKARTVGSQGAPRSPRRSTPTTT